MHPTKHVKARPFKYIKVWSKDPIQKKNLCEKQQIFKSYRVNVFDKTEVILKKGYPM
jgi:hypothetical protein